MRINYSFKIDRQLESLTIIEGSKGVVRYLMEEETTALCQFWIVNTSVPLSKQTGYENRKPLSLSHGSTTPLFLVSSTAIQPDV